jgi:hypothetical protein
VEDILQFCADFAAHHPPKYGGLNIDNWISAMVNDMGHAGKLHLDRPYEFSYTTPDGEEIRYKIRIAREDYQGTLLYTARREFEVGQVMEVTSEGELVRATPEDRTRPITRVYRTKPIPTAEMRIFDTLMDAKAVTQITQFWGSFVDKFANGPYGGLRKP